MYYYLIDIFFIAFVCVPYFSVNVERFNLPKVLYTFPLLLSLLLSSLLLLYVLPIMG